MIRAPSFGSLNHKGSAKRNAPGSAPLRRLRADADINLPTAPAESVGNDPEPTFHPFDSLSRLFARSFLGRSLPWPSCDVLLWRRPRQCALDRLIDALRFGAAVRSVPTVNSQSDCRPYQRTNDDQPLNSYKVPNARQACEIDEHERYRRPIKYQNRCYHPQPCI